MNLRLKTILTVILCILCTSAAFAADTVSENSAGYKIRSVKIGDGGMNTGFVMHPSDNKILYAKTDVGGLYRRDFDNNTWIPLTDSFDREMRNYYSIAGVGLDPNNTEVVYIACGMDWRKKGAVFKSTDRGNTWIKTNLDVTFSTGGSVPRYAGECIAVDPENSDVVYCGTQYEGLWKSTDGGMNWNRIDQIPTGITPTYANRGTANRDSGIRSLVFDDSGRLYAGVNPNSSAEGGVYVYDGNSWNKMSGSPKNVMVLRSVGNTVYASSLPDGNTSNSAELYKCENGIWERLDSPETKIGYVMDAVKDSAGNKIVFSVGINNNRLYYKKNNGSWNAVLGTDNNSRISGNRYWYSQLNYEVNAFKAYDDCGKIKAWLGNGAAIFSTANVLSSSSLYKCEVDGYEELCIYSLASPRFGKTRLFAGGMDYSGFRLTDTNDYSGVSIIANMKNDLYSGEFVHSHEMISVDVCANNNKFAACTFRSTGGGFNGAAVSDDGGESFVHFGNNWLETYGYAPGNIAVGAKPLANGYPALAAVGVVTDKSGDSGILYSDDFGRTWHKSSGIPSSILTADREYQRKVITSDGQNGNVFYINNLADGKLYISRDGGKTFAAEGVQTAAQAYSGYLRSSIEAKPYTSGEVWFSTYENGLLRSTDYGKTSEIIANVSNVEGFGFGAENPENGVCGIFMLGCVYGERGLYFSADNALTWQKINSSDNEFGSATAVCGDKSTYAAAYIATAGRGVFAVEPSDGGNLKMNAKTAAYSANTVTVEFSDSVETAGVNTNDFKLYNDSGEKIDISTLQWANGNHSCILTLDGTLSENSLYTVQISERVKNSNNAFVTASERELVFEAAELSPGEKVFKDELFNAEKMDSYFRKLTAFNRYDSDHSAMTAQSQYAEAVYRVNGKINDFTAKTVYHAVQTHDAQWRFYASSDGHKWERLIPNEDYTSEYNKPDSGWSFNYAKFETYTGSINQNRNYRYIKIIYPVNNEKELTASSSTRGLLSANISYTAKNFCKIGNVSEEGFTISFEREMNDVNSSMLTLRDSAGNNIAIENTLMSDDRKSCFVTAELPVQICSLEFSDNVKSITGIELSDICRQISIVR